MNDEVTPLPTAWQLADELVLARVEAQLFGAERPVTLGRYRVLRELGQGAMGQLLLAFDPDLQREVALKLVAPAQTSSPEARRRIVAEARAMARLSDPHVAQVYEVAELGGRLVVAMEYVDGEDLRAWLAGTARPWRAVLEVFLQAGAGLAAAHDKGLVHRDFKPDNVMLDRQGRAKVIDFGLARGEAVPGAGPSARPRALELTRTSGVLGTPSYLAPEQWEGSVASPQSDQFAFCVALFEAIAGERPFRGEHEDELRRALREGPTARWPSNAPRWLLRAVARGLSPEPAARWPGMHALLSAIDPERRRRRSIALGMFAITATLATTAAAAAYDPCRAAAAPILAVWDAGDRDAVRAAAQRTDADWGERSGERLVARFDEVAEAWARAATAVCAADRPELRAPRICLDDARARFADAIAESDRGVPALLVSAVARAELLPDPAACVDAPALAAYADPRPDPSAVVGHIAAAELHLGAMTVRGEATGYRDAITLGVAEAEAATAAAELIDHEPLLGRALALAGRLHLGEGDHARAEALLRRGLAMARRAADAPTAAAITADLVYAMSREHTRFREADELAKEAEGMIDALGRPPLLHARLLAHRASALAHAEDARAADAVALHEQVAAELEATLGSQHPATVVALGNIGTAQSYAGAHAEAAATLQRALAAAEDVWGTEHPRTAALLGALGLARMRAGDLEAAVVDLRRSLQLREAALGSAHPQVDDARYNLASVLRRRGEHAEAVALLAAGLAHVRARVGDDDDRLGPWWVAQGESLREIGELEGARAALDEALRIFERTGASARDYARVRFAAARAWHERDLARAHALAEQARRDAGEAHADKLAAEIDAWLAVRPR